MCHVPRYQTCFVSFLGPNVFLFPSAVSFLCVPSRPVPSKYEQGRDLPAADTNGLMDPFLKMQCQGEKLNTEEFMYLGKAVHRRRETVDPMWYFTWEADLSLPLLELQSYFPQVLYDMIDAISRCL